MSGLSESLASGRSLVGFFVTYPAAGMVERVGADWDWFWIDGQHGQLAYQDLLAMVRACDLVGKPAFVRTPSHERGQIGLALDMAPAGVIVPQVETVEQARACVQAAKFPPLGDRSYGGRRVVDRLGRGYTDTANQDTLLMVQIESPAAIERAEAIASVEGVDCVHYGTDDVMLRRGHAMATEKPFAQVAADLETIATACKRHGKYSAVIATDEPLLTRCHELGVSLIIGGSDIGVIASGSARASQFARGILSGKG